MLTLNGSLKLKDGKMEEKGLKFFDNLVDKQLSEALANWANNNGLENDYQIGWLKGALAAEMWKRHRGWKD